MSNDYLLDDQVIVVGNLIPTQKIKTFLIEEPTVQTGTVSQNANSGIFVPTHLHCIDDILGLDRDFAQQYLTTERAIDLFNLLINQLQNNNQLGDITNARNIGTGGVGVFAQKNNTFLEFFNIVAGDNVTVALDGNNIVISSTGGGGVTLPFSIDSFNGTPIVQGGPFADNPLNGSVIELGAVIPSFDFTATFNKTPDDSNMADPNLTVYNLVTDFGVTLSTSVAFTYSATVFQGTGEGDIGNSISFLLDATEGIDVDSRNKNFSYGVRVLWGAYDPSGYTGFFPNLHDPVTDYASDTALLDNIIAALTNNRLGTSRNGSYDVTAGATQKAYFAYPATYGLEASFISGAFPDGFFKVANDVPVTNQFGETITYVVYETDNVNLGAFTFTVS